jgi:hypothetical protein
MDYLNGNSFRLTFGVTVFTYNPCRKVASPRLEDPIRRHAAIRPTREGSKLH